jgi:hypothetical protein
MSLRTSACAIERTAGISPASLRKAIESSPSWAFALVERRLVTAGNYYLGPLLKELLGNSKSDSAVSARHEHRLVGKMFHGQVGFLAG